MFPWILELCRLILVLTRSLQKLNFSGGGGDKLTLEERANSGLKRAPSCPTEKLCP